MTEAEWLRSRDLFSLLSAEDPTVTGRKLRLFACHCLRSLGDVLPFESQECIKYMEKHLDGLLKWGDVVSRVNSRTIPYLLDTMASAAQLVTRGIPQLLVDPTADHTASECASWAAVLHRRGPNWRLWKDIVTYGGFVRIYTNEEEEAALLRNAPAASADMFLTAWHDIAGNPFRPVAFDHRWRTSTSIGLAQTMYDARDFAAMPILADALQDAGCEDEAILGHCRGDGPHVRGCWVVDLVLGKS
ncbi:hypothetical protein [Limnoglobus roseus]|uniref:SMI1/KNR4 family protein n=1 Tax=Limnoglobus roseus TaxID=2598579 RepID=A0A5C1A2X5_9BACT|nr:hypothetical protein [Limnoglobus roseus]QEL13461.1 hypothetical protein PX52LOC_00318 [Limnoglobus roseus]